MALDKIEQARREGMAYALRVAKDKGVEGLEQELKYRNATNIPIAISQKKLDECVVNIKQNTIDSVLLLATMVLRDKFDFGEVRLTRFMNHFNDFADSISGNYFTWDDCIQVLADECGIKIDIRHNDKNIIL